MDVKDGGPGGVGVVLRQFYIENPYKHTQAISLGAVADQPSLSQALLQGSPRTPGLGSSPQPRFDGPDKLCLVQVRWASACVQTYRIGTYGQHTMTLSDLCVAADQHHADAQPLKKMYRFRTRADTDPEDLASVQIEPNQMPAPGDLESILLRFFRPKPNAIATMKEVGDFLRDELIAQEDHASAVCDFCDMLLCHNDGICAPCKPAQEGRVGEELDVASQVWATRLPCGHVFHRDCIRLCLMDHNACPCNECNQAFESFCGGDLDEDWGPADDEEADCEFVSGDTLEFISENRPVWIRMAAVIQHFEAVDNMSITTKLLSPCGDANAEVGTGGEPCQEQRLSWGSWGNSSLGRDLAAYGSPPVSVFEGKQRQRHAFMRKLRDVLTCVDLPQLEEAGWKIWGAFDMMEVGVRDRNQLVSCELDAQSTAVVDHLLDMVTRAPEDIDRELRYGRTSPSSSPSANPCGGGMWQRDNQQQVDASEHMDEVLALLGLLASSARDRDGDVPSQADEPVLSTEQLRIYVVPLLEFLLAADSLGCAFDALEAGERDIASIFEQCGLQRSSPERFPVQRLVQAAVAADGLGPAGREAKRQELEGHSSEGLRRSGLLRVAMFHLALQSYERSSASVRGRRLSASPLKSGLRWLANVAKTLHRKGRQVVRAGDAMYMIEIAPYVGGETMLWLLGFRWTAGQGSPVGGGRLLAEMRKQKPFCKLDKLFASNACALLDMAVRCDRARSPPLLPSVNASPPRMSDGTPPRNKSKAPASQVTSRNLDRVCEWVASKVHGIGPDVWAVLELEVLPRLEDIGVGSDGNFTAALAQIRDGAREPARLSQTLRCDATTSDAIQRVVCHLKVLEAKENDFRLSC